MASDSPSTTQLGNVAWDIRAWLKEKYPAYTLEDRPNSCSLTNGKRRYSFNLFHGKLFFGIREDGDTRSVFNGFVETLEQVQLIDRLTTI